MDDTLKISDFIGIIRLQSPGIAEVGGRQAEMLAEAGAEVTRTAETAGLGHLADIIFV